MAASAPAIRVLVVDDSALVRHGLRSLFATHKHEPGIEIVAEAGTVAAAVQEVRRCRPEVVLLDIRLPDGTGFEACRQILKDLPDVRVLILTSVADDALVQEAIRAGAHGYLLKEIDARGLVQAVVDVAAGRSILDPAVTARVLELVKSGGINRSALAALSPQENRVLALIAEGCTNKEVGARLGLSEKTVKNYLSTVFDKLQVSRRGEAAAIFARERS